MGDLQGLDHRRIGRLIGRGNLGLGHAQACGPSIETIEFLREIVKGLITPCTHLVDDRSHIRVHIGGHLALRRQKRVKAGCEILVGMIEPENQSCLPRECTYQVSGWRGLKSVPHEPLTSVSCTSMHSTSRRMDASPDRTSSSVPAGSSSPA